MKKKAKNEKMWNIQANEQTKQNESKTISFNGEEYYEEKFNQVSTGWLYFIIFKKLNIIVKILWTVLTNGQKCHRI